VGANCRLTKRAFAVRSAPTAASSTVGALRSVSPLSAASQVHSAAATAAAVAVAAAGPSVAGVAAPPWPEQVSGGHEDGDRQ
jgi:hypothetical protein